MPLQSVIYVVALQICMKAIPYRKDFLKACTYGKEPDIDKVIDDIDIFVKELSGPLNVIIEIYDTENLHVYQK